MKAFGAFVKQLAKTGVVQAQTVAIYVRHPADNLKHVRREIEKDLHSGRITQERFSKLNALVDTCVAWHKEHGRVDEHPDNDDWISLGDGARMRRTHYANENSKKDVFFGKTSIHDNREQEEEADE